MFFEKVFFYQCNNMYIYIKTHNEHVSSVVDLSLPSFCKKTKVRHETNESSVDRWPNNFISP